MAGGTRVASVGSMRNVVRIAAMADLHCTKASAGALQPVFAKVAESADVLLLCGDLTDYGLADEARVLAKELTAAKVPKVAVLGNHDFESDAAAEVTQILADAGVQVLNTSNFDDDRGPLRRFNP